MSKKRFCIAFTLTLLLCIFTLTPVFAEGEAEENEPTYEITFVKDNYTFSPNFIIPDRINGWKCWLTTRLIELGTISYEEVISIKNTGDAPVNFDAKKTILRIQGENSKTYLDNSIFTVSGLAGELKPNEEREIKVKLDQVKMYQLQVQADTYKGDIKFWIEESEEYFPVTVDMKMKSPIWLALVWLIIGAAAPPLGRKLVDLFNVFETKSKLSRLYRLGETVGKNTFGLIWFKQYFKKTWDEYKPSGDTQTEDRMLIAKKVIEQVFQKEKSLMFWKLVHDLPDKKAKKEKTKLILAQYGEFDHVPKDKVDEVIGKVNAQLEHIYSDLQLPKSEGDRKVQQIPELANITWFEKTKYYFANYFSNIWTFIAWLFVTGIMVFIGLSEQYTAKPLWGVDPLADWGAVFTWALSSNFVTSSAKDLIEKQILKIKVESSQE